MCIKRSLEHEELILLPRLEWNGSNVVKLPPGLESEKEKTKWKEYPQKYSSNTHNCPEIKGYKRFK